MRATFENISSYRNWYRRLRASYFYYFPFSCLAFFQYYRRPVRRIRGQRGTRFMHVGASIFRSVYEVLSRDPLSRETFQSSTLIKEAPAWMNPSTLLALEIGHRSIRASVPRFAVCISFRFHKQSYLSGGIKHARIAFSWSNGNERSQNFR